MQYSIEEAIALTRSWKESASIVRVIFSDTALGGTLTALVIEPPSSLPAGMVASVSLKLLLPNGIPGSSLIDVNFWGSEEQNRSRAYCAQRRANCDGFTSRYYRPNEITLIPQDSTFPLKEGDILFTDHPDSEVNQDLKFRFDVAFNEVGIVEGKPILPTLVEIADYVEYIITSMKNKLI